MSEIFAENLSGMRVMGSDGTELGPLYNITTNVKTGDLLSLLVNPAEDLNPSSIPFDRNEKGQLLVPVKRVQSVGDHIIVEL